LRRPRIPTQVEDLLGETPLLTGYEIAKRLGRPKSGQVYQVLSELEREEKIFAADSRRWEISQKIKNPRIKKNYALTFTAFCSFLVRKHWPARDKPDANLRNLIQLYGRLLKYPLLEKIDLFERAFGSHNTLRIYITTAHRVVSNPPPIERWSLKASAISQRPMPKREGDLMNCPDWAPRKGRTADPEWRKEFTFQFFWLLSPKPTREHLIKIKDAELSRLLTETIRRSESDLRMRNMLERKNIEHLKDVLASMR